MCNVYACMYYTCCDRHDTVYEIDGHRKDIEKKAIAHDNVNKMF